MQFAIDNPAQKCYNTITKLREVRKMARNYYKIIIDDNRYTVYFTILKANKIFSCENTYIFTLYKTDNITAYMNKISEYRTYSDFSILHIQNEYKNWLTKALEKDLKNA